MYGHHSSTRRAGGRGRVRGRLHTRVTSLARVHVHACIHAHNPKIYVAYLRVRKARTFTGVREIIYSGIDFLASDALSCHSALTIHLQRPARSSPDPVAALISRNEKDDERLADAFSANERRSDVSRFFARMKIRLYGIIRQTGRLYFFFLDS